MDTVSAPIGTVFAFDFVVLDRHMPAASARITRTITVVSPCAPRQIYCPKQTKQCGSAPCSARSIEGSAERETQPPELQLHTASNRHVHVSGAGIQIYTICGVPPRFNLSMCGTQQQPAITAACDLSTQGPSGEDLPQAIVQTQAEGCVASKVRAGACVACVPKAVQQGSCLPSVQQYMYTLIGSDHSISSPVHVNVTVAERRLEAALQAAISFDGLQSASASTFEAEPLLDALEAALEQQLQASAGCQALLTARVMLDATEIAITGSTAAVNGTAVVAVPDALPADSADAAEACLSGAAVALAGTALLHGNATISKAHVSGTDLASCAAANSSALEAAWLNAVVMDAQSLSLLAVAEMVCTSTAPPMLHLPTVQARMSPQRRVLLVGSAKLSFLLANNQFWSSFQHL